ncbi:LacI family transcriptional regulator [Sphingobacterium sp. SGG-5]|uniref:substrate-binding domain-containing protein n=1 Tax=Sphingobacterium sp. SGG-5 TaxID=2710881 RepID=UPI0013EB3B47|nr:LacI family DNA-binding transcriptional regulator [Sphingobacterium sp. SGG-5]NGM62252.1 LacI family transcriptional regulator [Sphingobacterium sp. SGG-5]
MVDGKEKKNFGIKDIARLANVSIATVDRVLNNRKDVSDATRQKIKDIIKEYNYQPNLYARSLSVKNNLNFAVLIPKTSLETGYWQLCLDGIEKGIKELEPFGIQTTVFLYDQEDVRTFVKVSEQILHGNFNAVVIAPIFIKETEDFVRQCHKRKLQTIYINSDIPSKSTLGYIGPDLNSTGRLAGNLTSYLVNPGAKILILNVAKGLENYKYLDTKIEGYKEYLHHLDRQFEIDIADIPYNVYEEVERELLRKMKTGSPDVLFVTNSRVSVVGQFFYEHPEITKPYLIGFDFLEANVNYLTKGVVDFLICQRPDKQGYLALNYLYRFFLLKEDGVNFKPMPIDIITIENYMFYEN